MDIDLIWVCGEAEFFCEKGWTGNRRDSPSGKSLERQSKLAARRIPPMRKERRRMTLRQTLSRPQATSLEICKGPAAEAVQAARRIRLSRYLKIASAERIGPFRPAYAALMAWAAVR